MNRKQFQKLLKSTHKYLRKRRKTILRYGVPIVLVLVSFCAGGAYQRYHDVHTQPRNIVWSIDASVSVPSDLRNYLMQKNECQSYRGSNAPSGTGLWAVTQIDQGAYAKLAYGCSWSLSDHAVAVKQAKGWTIISPSLYYSDPIQGVPLCTAVVQYKIPPSIEGFCSNDSGKLTKNPNPGS